MNESDQDKQDLISSASPVETKASPSEAVLPGRDPDAPVTKDDVAQKVDATRRELLEMERKHEELVREKNELEELRRKQDEYVQGRREMLERLNRSLIILEHEDVEAQRLAESIKNARASFGSMKEQLEGIREDQWNNANLKAELTKALAVVDTARNEFNHYRARIDVLDEKQAAEPSAAAGPMAEFLPSESWISKTSFGDLVKLGFAVTLPLIVLGALLLIVVAAKQ